MKRHQLRSTLLSDGHLPPRLTCPLQTAQSGTVNGTKVRPSAPTPAPGQVALSNCTVNFYQGVTPSEMITGCKREALLEEAPECKKAAIGVPPPPLQDISLAELDNWFSVGKRILKTLELHLCQTQRAYS